MKATDIFMSIETRCRGVGKTMALVKAAKENPGTVIICGDEHFARRLRHYHGVDARSISSSPLCGERLTPLYDTTAIESLLREAQKENDALFEQLRHAWMPALDKPRWMFLPTYPPWPARPGRRVCAV